MCHHLAGDVVHLVGIDAGERVGELPLRIGGRAGADLQHGIRLQERHGAGNRAHDPAHQLAGHNIDRRPLRRRLQKHNQHDLIRAEISGVPAHGEGAAHRGIRLQDLLRLALIRVHLVGDDPSCATITPRMKELSPTGRKALGTM